MFLAEIKREGEAISYSGDEVVKDETVTAPSHWVEMLYEEDSLSDRAKKTVKLLEEVILNQELSNEQAYNAVAALAYKLKELES